MTSQHHTQRRRRCIDCGTSCNHNAYRCRSCSARECAAWLFLLGRPNLRRGSGNPAAVADYYRRLLAEFVADLEADLDAGIEPARIVAALGIQRESLHRRLTRGGYDQLAARFVQHRDAA